MVLDYRNTRFSFSRLRKRRRRQRLRWAVALFLLTALSLLVVRGVQLRKVRRLQEGLLAGDTTAVTELNRKSRPLFTARAMVELQSLSHLLNGRLEQGEQGLSDCGHSGAVDARRFLDRMVDQGRYAALGLYLDFLRRRDSPSSFHRVLYFTAMYQPKQARRTAAALAAPARQLHSKALHILEDTWKQLETGRIACIHDRSGKALGEYDPASKAVRSLVPGLDLSPFAAELERGLRFFTLTLDAGLQKHVHEVFSKYHGSCVILDPAAGAILAAYSKPLEKAAGNAAWKRRYEAGSIIKTLTYLAYSQTPDPRLFPLQCHGNIQLDGRVFYDWTRHGRIDSPQTALVVSCNIAYARMGLAVGGDGLSKMFQAFLFNSGPLNDRFLLFQLGDFNPPPLPPRRLADLAVGLEEVRITTLHGALIAAAISQSGSMPSPHLIATEKNVLRLGIYHHTPTLKTHIPGGRTFLQLREAMTRVISDPRGTAHRALLSTGPVTAAKTGTAGDPKKGLDAVMIAFMPATRPSHAFAFRLERGGKAELNGARVLKALIAAPPATIE